MPLHRLDIASDGTATPATDDAVIGPCTYRWHHYDMTDPAFKGWATTHLPPIPAGTLMQSETRPRCDVHEGGLMMNLRGVNLNSDSSADQMVAVRMWITDQTVVTVRVRRVFAIEDMREACTQGHGPATSSALIEDLATRLNARIQTTVFDLAATVDTLEDELDDDAPLPPNMAELRRSAIRLRRYLGPQRDALQKLSATNIPADANPNVRRELANQAMLTVEELDSLQSRLTTIHDHHATRADAAQNRNSYALSIVAAVFLPLGFLTGLFGVNVAGMPGVGHPAAFWVLTLSMVVIAAAGLAILRWLRWI